eukprot:TCONS_00064010-protein
MAAKFRFLIDTGASVSVVQSVIYNALWRDIVPLYYSPQIIETVNGENAVNGEIYVDLDFQKFILQGQRFLVTHCAEYDGILGRDFLRSARAVVDVNKHTMICHERFIIKLDFDVKQWACDEIYDFIQEQQNSNRPSQRNNNKGGATNKAEDNLSNGVPVIPAERKVHVIEDVQLEPFSEKIIPGVASLKPVEGQDYIVENLPFFSEKQKVICASIVTIINRQQVPCRILNPSGERVTLYAGTNVASIDEVTVIEEVPIIQMQTKPQEKLEVDLTDSDLNDQQQAQLQRLFREYGDIFAVDQSELGRTSIIKHHIDIENYVPIGSKPYRASHEDGKKIKEHIKDMLEQDVIRESTSPYSFPVILV